MLESALSLGLVLGLRHASDADHVCAIASLLRTEQGLRAAARTAILWSLGHSLTFFAVGAVLVSGRLTVPEAWNPVMELLVASLLVTLGAVQWRHADCPLPESPGPVRPQSLRVMLVGIVHGLAGSAGIALLALATVKERMSALLFLLLFGLGVSGGMVLLTLLLSLPLSFVVRNSERWRSRILKGTSALSIALGTWMGLSALREFVG
ncbi:HupE/UreJ family protein [Myxococcus sp. AB036A]|uniref:HoxN/HupN/NixA family nickel/cobalt transporter n=1 Tax=Myxococcus sp. AB036A TaxID=2562793 RepID=UPI0011463F27|nr:HupE/UreJ family protein [Myxococcus sp. AB036A]